MKIRNCLIIMTPDSVIEPHDPHDAHDFVGNSIWTVDQIPEHMVDDLRTLTNPKMIEGAAEHARSVVEQREQAAEATRSASPDCRCDP